MSLGQKKMKLISCKWLCVIAFGLVAFIIGFGGGYLVHVQPRTSKASSTTAPTQPTPSGPNTTIPAETTTTRAPAGECWKEIHWMILSHSHLLNLVNSMKSLKSFSYVVTELWKHILYQGKPCIRLGHGCHVQTHLIVWISAQIYE